MAQSAQTRFSLTKKKKEKLFHTVLFTDRKKSEAQPQTINSYYGSTSSSQVSLNTKNDIQKKKKKRCNKIVALLRFNYGCLFTSNTFKNKRGQREMKIPLISLKNKNIKNDDEKMMKIYTKHVIDKKNY